MSSPKTVLSDSPWAITYHWTHHVVSPPARMHCEVWPHLQLPFLGPPAGWPHEATPPHRQVRRLRASHQALPMRGCRDIFLGVELVVARLPLPCWKSWEWFVLNLLFSVSTTSICLALLSLCFVSSSPDCNSKRNFPNIPPFMTVQEVFQVYLHLVKVWVKVHKELFSRRQCWLYDSS